MANPKVSHNRVTLAGVYNIRYKEMKDYESIDLRSKKEQGPTIKTDAAVNNYRDSPSHSPSIGESDAHMKDVYSFRPESTDQTIGTLEMKPTFRNQNSK